jgi:uncharacterized protein (DUF1810 family)
MNHNLQRFIDAQEPVYTTVLTELRAGRKRSHWIWFIFPQHRTLGRSATAVKYGLASLAEAQAFLAHPLLGARLRECTDVMLATPRNLSAHDILGLPDDLKFHSCMTTFALAAPDERRFHDAIVRFFSGVQDARSVELFRG